MTVAQLKAKLADLPDDAVVLLEGDGGLSRIATIEFVDAQGPGAPAEVILGADMSE